MSFTLTSVLGGLITEDPVRWQRWIRLDEIHLGVSSSTPVNVLTLLTWIATKGGNQRKPEVILSPIVFLFVKNISSSSLTRNHRYRTPGYARIPALLILGQDCLFKLLDLQPDVV